MAAERGPDTPRDLSGVVSTIQGVDPVSPWCHSGVTDITPHVSELQRQLAVAGSTGDDAVQAAAERLAASLEAAARLTILDALADAAGEITSELAPGSVDVRLRGRDVDFVVTLAEPAGGAEAPRERAPQPPADDDDAATSRTTLRIPDALKARAERAATAEGVSLNSWLVRAIAAALEPAEPARQTRATSLTGWMR